MSQMPSDPALDSNQPLGAVLGLYQALVTVLARPASLTAMLDDALQTIVRHLGANGGAVTIWQPGSASPGFGACCGCLDRADIRGRLSLGLHLAERTVADELLAALAVEWGEVAASGAGQALLGATAWRTHRGEYGVACIVGVTGAGAVAWRQEALAAAIGLVGHAMERMRLAGEMEARLAKRDARWASLYETSIALARALDSEGLLDDIVRRAIDLLHARGGALSLVDDATGDSIVKVAYIEGEPAPAILGQRARPGEGLVGQVIARGEPMLIPDHDFGGPTPPSLHTAVIAAPLFVQGVCVGALAVGDRPARRQLSHDDLQALALLAQQAGALLERERGRRHDDILALHGERNRLARELHDGLAQSLASLLLKAELCRTLAGAGNAALAHELDQLADGLQRAIRETRSAIASLHDAPATGERLVDALGLLTARFQEQSGITVELTWQGSPDLPLPPAHHMALLRVAQEALTNVRKHAQAGQVRVNLHTTRRKTVVLSVQDDGCGISHEQMAAATDGGHYGVLNMRARIEELGGSLRIKTGPGCGTTVKAVLPLLRTGAGGRAKDQRPDRR